MLTIPNLTELWYTSEGNATIVAFPDGSTSSGARALTPATKVHLLTVLTPKVPTVREKTDLVTIAGCVINHKEIATNVTYTVDDSDRTSTVASLCSICCNQC